MNFEHDAKSVFEDRNPPVYVNANRTKLKVILTMNGVYDENGKGTDRTIEMIFVKQ